MMRLKLSEQLSKEIFLALVEEQDAGASPAVSKEIVAKRFGISQNELAEVERQGLNFTWPPLT
jgi:hypothetical protein